MKENQLFTWNDYSFRFHFEAKGHYYGALWQGELPRVWSLIHLAKLTQSEFSRFQLAQESDQ